MSTNTFKTPKYKKSADMIGSPEYSSTPADQFVKHKFTKPRHSSEGILINSNYDVAATASLYTPSKFIDTL